MLEISPLYMVIKRVIPPNLEFELSLGRIAKATRNNAECLVVSTFHKYSGLKRPVVILVNVASDCPKRVKNDMYCCATRNTGRISQSKKRVEPFFGSVDFFVCRRMQPVGRWNLRGPGSHRWCFSSVLAVMFLHI